MSSSNKKQAKIFAAELDIILVEKLEGLHMWRGPSVLGEIKRVHQSINSVYLEIDAKIRNASRKMGEENFSYISVAVSSAVFFTGAIFYSTIHPTQALRLSTVWIWGAFGLALPLISLLRTAARYRELAILCRDLFQLDFKQLTKLKLEMQRSRTDDFNDRPDIQLEQYKRGEGATLWNAINPSKPREDF